MLAQLVYGAGSKNVHGCNCHWRCWVGVELLPAQGPWAGAAFWRS
jgi:hypothetical protein